MINMAVANKEEFYAECDFPSCKNKAINACKFCNRDFCETHFKPKHTASRSYIQGLKDPTLIKIYEEEDKDENGHPCPKYDEWWSKEYEIEQERLRKQKASMWDTITALKNWVEKERSISSNPGTCHAPDCPNVDNSHYCPYCRGHYCKYHAISRKAAFLDHLGGHVCVGLR